MPLFSISPKYLSNIFWLFLDYAFRLIGGYFITIWLAREIGPANFGIYNYATANSSILAAIAVAGLHGVAIKFLVEKKQAHTALMGSAFFIRFGAAIFGYACLLLYLLIDNKGLTDKIVLSILIGFKVMFNPFTVIELYFEAIVKSKFRVFARNIAYVIRSLLLVLFILLEWPLLALGFILLAEEALAVIGLVYFYSKQGYSLIKWHFNKTYAKEMMREAWPMVISSAGAMLYMKVDQVMIVELLNETEGGFYAVAVKISELFSFLPGVLIGTFFPTIVESKSQSKELYHAKMRKLILFMLLIASVLGAGIYIFAHEIVYYSFGADYISAVSIIRIHIWSLILSFTATVLSRWLIVEKLTRFSIVRHSFGMVVNIALNFLLIPKFGGEGAAYASIISLFCAVLLFAAFDKRTFTFLELVFTSFFVFKRNR